MSGFEARWITVSWPSMQRSSAAQILEIAMNDAQTRVLLVMRIVPLAAA